MTTKRKADDADWRKTFGNILALVFQRYNFDYIAFAEKHFISSSAVRYWFIGRSFPSAPCFWMIKEFLQEALPESSPIDEDVRGVILAYFEKREASGVFYDLRIHFPAMNSFVVEVLNTCYSLAKHREDNINTHFLSISPTGRTQAVIFDFDGTLTLNSNNKTTWEMIWSRLGYDVRICQNFHKEFSQNRITHEEWCQITGEYFKRKNLHRSTIESIASKIRLIPYAKETFKALYEYGIKIYIVSGSILQIVKPVLRPLYKYIDDIKANDFRFGDNGILTEIIGTKYDFNGKADYIMEAAKNLRISTRDILFVGNSLNDQFAHLSGSRTLCINPVITDITDTVVWNNCIQQCTDLREVLAFLKY